MIVIYCPHYPCNFEGCASYTGAWPSVCFMPIEERFFSRFRKGSDSECWEWRGTLDAKGYGRFRYKYAIISAHRYSYTHFVGPFDPSLVIDHLCRTPYCVNPKHLEPVTRTENLKRGLPFDTYN